MKHFVIISQLFYPRESAIINCLYTLIKDMIKRGDRVTVISVAYDENTPLREEKDGYTILRIPSPEQIKIDSIISKSKNPAVNLLMMPFAKIWFNIRPFVENIRMKKLYKKFIKTEKVDYILSTLEPKQNHDAAYKIADLGAKWILLNYDVFVYNIIRSQNIEKCKKQEKRWLTRAAGVLNLDGIPQENGRNGYFPYENLPNQSMYLTNLNFTEEPKTENHEKFVMRYTGKVYYKGKGIKPDPGLDECTEMLEFLKKLDPEKYSAEFYGGCDVCLESEYDRLPECVSVMGNVPVPECRRLIFGADALINISTCTSCLVPSKILEYIASGKPIINFYHTESDPSFQYLRQYPLAVNLKFGEEPDVNDVCRRLSEMKPLTKAQLCEIYKDYISENVTDSMIGFMKSI